MKKDPHRNLGVYSGGWVLFPYLKFNYKFCRDTMISLYLPENNSIPSIICSSSLTH